MNPLVPFGTAMQFITSVLSILYAKDACGDEMKAWSWSCGILGSLSSTYALMRIMCRPKYKSSVVTSWLLALVGIASGTYLALEHPCGWTNEVRVLLAMGISVVLTVVGQITKTCIERFRY